jgi:hypothetical protein
MLTKPFGVDGRVYMTCVQDLGRNFGGSLSSEVAAYPYVSNEIYELYRHNNGLGDNRGERLLPAGVHDIGTASGPWAPEVISSNTIAGQGAAQTVSATAAKAVAYANHSRSRSVTRTATLSTTGNPLGFNIRALDAVVLDGDFQLQAATLQQGQVFCSGAYSTWYDGVETMESHTPAPAIDWTKYTGQPVAVDDTTLSLSGNLADGDYFYTAFFAFRDDTGALHRGITGPTYEITVNAAASEDVPVLLVKTTPFTYRWFYDGLMSIYLYRASTADGAAIRCNPQLLSPNDDEHATRPAYDAGDYEGEVIYTAGGILENVCPEGFKWCMTHNERVWTAGHFRRARIQYSKRFTPGTAAELQFVPEFHESMGFVLPEGEDCTGLAPLDDKVIIFSDRAIYAVAGIGPDDAGLNSDFSQLTLITDKIGCDDGSSVVSFPGGVMFLGDGIVQLLGRQLEVSPVGESIRDQLDLFPTIVSADCLPERYQVLLVCSTGSVARILVYDYRLDEWVHWIPLDSAGAGLDVVDACVHQGEYYIATSAEVFKYDTSTYRDDTSRFVSALVETAWIQSAGPAGWKRVRDAMLNAEYVNQHSMQLSVYSDFSSTPSQTYTWDDAALVAMFEHSAAKREQLKLRVIRQKCQAIKLRMQAFEYSVDSDGSPFKLFSLGLRIGTKPGLVRVKHDQLA